MFILCSTLVSILVALLALNCFEWRFVQMTDIFIELTNESNVCNQTTNKTWLYCSYRLSVGLTDRSHKPNITHIPYDYDYWTTTTVTTIARLHSTVFHLINVLTIERTSETTFKERKETHKQIDANVDTSDAKTIKLLDY